MFNYQIEHLEKFLLHEDVRNKLSGRFKMEVVESKNYKPQFICHFEIGGNDSMSLSAFKSKFGKILIEELIKVNSEYRDVLTRVGEKAYPIVKLHRHGDPNYFPKNKVIKTS